MHFALSAREPLVFAAPDGLGVVQLHLVRLALALCVFAVFLMTA